MPSCAIYVAPRVTDCRVSWHQMSHQYQGFAYPMALERYEKSCARAACIFTDPRMVQLIGAAILTIAW